MEEVWVESVAFLYHKVWFLYTLPHTPIPPCTRTELNIVNTCHRSEVWVFAITPRYESLFFSGHLKCSQKNLWKMPCNHVFSWHSGWLKNIPVKFSILNRCVGRNKYFLLCQAEVPPHTPASVVLLVLLIMQLEEWKVCEYWMEKFTYFVICSWHGFRSGNSIRSVKSSVGSLDTGVRFGYLKINLFL